MRFLWSRPQFLWTAASSVLASKMVGLSTGPTTLSTTLPTPLIRRRIDPEIAAAPGPLLMQPRAFFAQPTHDVALLGVNWFHQVRTVAAITTEAQETGWRVVVPLLHESPPTIAAPAAVVPGPLTHQTRHARDARPTYERMCASEEHVARQVVDAMRAAGRAPILALVPPVFLYADSLPWRIRRLAKTARVTTLSVEPGDDDDDNEDDRPITTFFSPQGEYVIHTFAYQGRTS